ncbi:unnamed protein product [Jaminaea pallidilutea]
MMDSSKDEQIDAGESDLKEGSTSSDDPRQEISEPIPVNPTDAILTAPLAEGDDSQQHPDASHGHTNDEMSINSIGEENKDESAGEENRAWSVNATPVDEQDSFQLPSNSEREDAISVSSSSHEAQTSEQAAPMKYAEEEDGNDARAATGSSAPSAERSGASYGGQPSGPAVDLDGVDASIDLDETADDLDSHLSEFERAGLDFVDISLGTGGTDGNGVYGKNGADASKSRSGLQIRTDSLSSDGRTGSGEPSASSKLRFWQRRKTGDDIAESSSGPSVAAADYLSPSKSDAREDDGDVSASRNEDVPSGASTPRRLSGRYRGRTSRPGTPTLPSSASSDLQPAQQSHQASTSQSAAPDMWVAGDDGEITQVEPSYSVTDNAAAESQNEDVAPPTQVTIPPAKADTSESREALDQSAAEAAANGASEQAEARSGLRASGRSGGPAVTTGKDEGSEDVRQATAEETEARDRSQAASGRSAGPIAGDSKNTSTASNVASEKAETTQPKHAVTGGRSSGPVAAATAVAPTSPTSSQHVRKPSLGSSSGPSALERYMSRTRQQTLPPKTRQEDQRHLQDFESMMRSFREHEIKRQKEDREKQRRKEEELAQSTRVWESEILRGDWRAARAKGGKLKYTWWKGAPPSLRGRAWQLAIGNGRMLPRNLCTSTKARVQQLKESDSWPPVLPSMDGLVVSEDEDPLHAMEEDLERTLPSLRLFQKDGGALHDDLKEILECLILLRADQASEIAKDRSKNAGAAAPRRASKVAQHPPRLYEPGLSILAATLLLNVSQAETLLDVLNLISSRPWLRSLYSMDPAHQVESNAFERVLNTLLADQMPKVYANLQSNGVDPSHYARDWVKTLFVPLLPFDVVCRLWDNILLEEEEGTDSMVFRTCLALVNLLSSRLYVPDRLELTSILQGRNRAALGVWYRFVQTQAGASGAGIGAAGGSALSTEAAASQQAIASLPPDSPLKASGGLDKEQRNDTDGPSVSSNGDAKEQSDGQEDTSDQTPSNNLSHNAVEAPLSWVPRDSLFSIYAVGEDNLFEALEEQTGEYDGMATDGDGAGNATGRGSNTSAVNRTSGQNSGWWRESTLKRLIERETRD